jgi:hypothetical protein
MHVWVSGSAISGTYEVTGYSAETRIGSRQFWPETKGFETPEAALSYLSDSLKGEISHLQETALRFNLKY